MNRAFVKLVEEDLGYPKGKWEASLIDEYLAYTLDLLDIFNSISSSLSHLQNVRLSLLRALNLIQACSTSSSPGQFKSVNFQPRKLKNYGGNNVVENVKEGAVRTNFCSKEGTALQALVEMKGVALWVCGVMLSVLGGDIDKCLEIKGPRGIIDLNSRVFGETIEADLMLKEVKEVNEAVALLSSALALGKSGGGESESLERKLEGFANQLEGAEKEVNCLFSDVMASRNQLLDCLRLKE